jgi:hypothetical protein
MGWSASAIFQQAIKNPLLYSVVGSGNATLPTGYSVTGGILSDVINCALFGNTGTPNKADTLANSAYSVGQWTTTNELPGTGGYTQGGVALGTKSFTLDSGSSSMCFTAANPSWTSATLANVYGDLVYDNTISGGTVAKQGLCFNYFGGSQSVTSGTFTIQWATPGGAAVTAVFNVSV